MVIIIGAGLSGLLTAYLLKKEGIPFKILEARSRVGGRIHTLNGTDKAAVEMGATWFNQQHAQLISLLENLGLPYFEQRMDRTVFYQASEASPTQLVQIPPQAPSYRIQGGTSVLIDRLLKSLDTDDVLLNQSVKHINISTDAVQVQTHEAFKGNAVVLALPPKLWAKNIAFDPPLPPALVGIANQTQTWMEDSIKVSLTYDAPFWEKDGLSGTIFSNAGPITEFYDHSNYEYTKYALCGFVTSSLKDISFEVRQARILNQLKTVYGTQAELFTSYEECVWSAEDKTYTSSDEILGRHQNNGNPIFRESLFNDKIIISCTESAVAFPGYMEGAVVAAKDTVAKLIKRC